MSKSLIIRSIIITTIVGIVSLGGIIAPQVINADLKNSGVKLATSTLISNGHLTVCMIDSKAYMVVKTIKMVVTGYSSDPDQTDDTPFITASGKHVATNYIANNGLPFGTKVKINIPGFENTIFVVEDRMHPRMGDKHADIWFASRQEAQRFGARHNVEVQVLES